MIIFVCKRCGEAHEIKKETAEKICANSDKKIDQWSSTIIILASHCRICGIVTRETLPEFKICVVKKTAVEG